MNNKLILFVMMGIFLITFVAAAETNFTEGTMGGFNTAIISLTTSFTIFIAIIVAAAVFFFILKGGAYGVNPITVIIIGVITVIVCIFLTPAIIEFIVEAIWR